MNYQNAWEELKTKLNRDVKTYQKMIEESDNNLNTSEYLFKAKGIKSALEDMRQIERIWV